MDYELPRLAFRDVARSTDARTLISVVIPAGVFFTDSFNYVRPRRYFFDQGEVVQQVFSNEETFYLLGLFNSFALDYYIRLSVSEHVSIFFAYELPIPQVSDSLRTQLASTAKRLQEEAMEPEVRREVWAGLEASIARGVFGLSVDQMRRILETFKYGNIDVELKKWILELF